jgi:hypothetical protein
MSSEREDPTKEIITLHLEIVGHLRESLKKAIRIGELLLKQRAGLRHGEFRRWIEGSLPFSSRTAKGYMKVPRKGTLLESMIRRFLY